MSDTINSSDPSPRRCVRCGWPEGVSPDPERLCANCRAQDAMPRHKSMNIPPPGAAIMRVDAPWPDADAENEQD